TRVETGSHCDACKRSVGEAQFISKAHWDTGRKSSSAAKNRIENLKRIVVGTGSSYSEMSHIDVQLLGRHLNELDTFAFLSNWLGISWKGQRFRFPASKRHGDFRQKLRHAKIAHDGKDYVIGDKIAPVEIPQVGTGQPLNGLRITVGRPVQRMILIHQFV